MRLYSYRPIKYRGRPAQPLTIKFPEVGDGRPMLHAHHCASEKLLLRRSRECLAFEDGDFATVRVKASHFRHVRGTWPPPGDHRRGGDQHRGSSTPTRSDAASPLSRSASCSHAGDQRWRGRSVDASDHGCVYMWLTAAALRCRRGLAGTHGSAGLERVRKRREGCGRFDTDGNGQTRNRLTGRGERAPPAVDGGASGSVD